MVRQVQKAHRTDAATPPGRSPRARGTRALCTTGNHFDDLERKCINPKCFSFTYTGIHMSKDIPFVFQSLVLDCMVDRVIVWFMQQRQPKVCARALIGHAHAQFCADLPRLSSQKICYRRNHKLVYTFWRFFN